MPRRKKIIQEQTPDQSPPKEKSPSSDLTSNSSRVELIPCVVKNIPEFSFKSGEERMGRYDGCLYPVVDYGFTKWAFSCYLRPTAKDIENYLLDGITELDLLKGCISFLNQPPPREKYQKRASVPALGNIELEPLYYKVKKIGGIDYFVTTLLTDSPKNKNLWGEGYCPGKIGRREENGIQ